MGKTIQFPLFLRRRENQSDFPSFEEGIKGCSFGLHKIRGGEHPLSPSYEEGDIEKFPLF
jgi:hypothetical protein